ncbi:MAG: c-type cytochrome [Neptuniibacter sp.]
MRSLITLITVLSIALLTGCEEEAITPDRMKSGAELYGYYCESCHAKQGPGARMEKIAGKDPMPAYKIILLIKYGYNARHNMPAFHDFSDEKAALLAQYVVQMQTENYKKKQQ